MNIPLVNGRGFTQVDEADAAILAGLRIYLKKGERTDYADYYSPKTGAKGLLHRLIMGAKPGLEVDHIDYNGLNNTRANLRLCSPKQNRQHRLKRRDKTGFKGVYPDKHGRYIVQIQGDYLGYYKTELEAVEAYNREAVKRFGSFAELNVVE